MQDFELNKLFCERCLVMPVYSTVELVVQFLSILKLNKNFNNKTKLFNKQTGSLKCCLGALGLVNKQFFLRRKWKINPTNIYFVDH